MGILRVGTVALLILGGWGIAGVSPAHSSSPWSSFDQTTGLIDNAVRVIVPDGEGKLWIGTRRGLSIYDGERWQGLTPSDGLPDGDINSIFLDSRGQAWIGAKRGFGLYRDGEWSRLGLPGAGEGEKVSVVADGEGTIWFGYGGGLMRFARGAEEIAAVPEMEGVAVTALLSAREEGVWVGTAEGPAFFDGSVWRRFGERDGLPGGLVTALLEDSRGTVWVGTDRGLMEYDGLGWSVYGPEGDMPNPSVTALAEDRFGRIWVGTRGGAGWYDGYDWIWVDSQAGMPSEEIFALCPDRNGSIWIGTSRGLIKYDTSWSRLPALSYDDKPPRSPLLRSAGGVIYTGTDEGVLEKEGRRAEWLGPDEGITGTPTVLFEDSEERIWLGTDRGLYLYDRGLEKHFLPPEIVREAVERGSGVFDVVERRYYDRYQGLKDERVTAVAEDGEGGVWVGTGAGLSRYLDGMWDLLEEVEVLGRGEITALASAGRSLWAGTPSGLWRRGEGGWMKVSSPGAPGEEGILSLLTESSGSLWVGTERGAFHWDGERWNRHDESSGLIGGRVAAIYRDAGGVLWFGTDAGVVQHDGSRWSAFSEADGLHVNSISDIIGVGEELWFGSPEGVSTYRPDRSPPDTRISTLPGEVVGASSFLFEFTGSDFETPAHRMQYSWRFDDGPWSPFSEAPRVTVSDMINGTHTFSVRAMDQGLNIDPAPAQVTFQVDTGLFDLELVAAEFEELYASLYQFYASDRDYAARPAARIAVRNRFDQDLRVKVSLFVPGLMDFPTDRIATVKAREVLEIPLRIELNEEVLGLEKSSTRQALLTMQYSLRGELKESSTAHPVTIFEKHTMTWEEPERIGLYVTHLDEAVESFARGVVGIFREAEKDAIIYDNLLRGIEIFDALGALGVRYIADPDNPYGGFTVARPALDLVRYPRETLLARSGDCDDVSVLYAALLQNIGIDTALVDVFDHVFVLFDTGLKRGQGGQVTKNPDLLHIDGKDRIWIPVEVTLLGKTFTEAWEVGARMLAERKYEVVEMKKAWEKYTPLQLGGEAGAVSLPTREQIGALFDEDLRLQEQTLVSGEIRRLREILTEDPGNVAVLNSLGIMLAKRGYLRQAAGRFRRVVELAPSFAGGYGNLANVLYEREEYEEAIKMYLESLRLDPASPEVNVELALTYCEVGRFDEARKHYGAAMNLSQESGDAALLHDAGAAEN